MNQQENFALSSHQRELLQLQEISIDGPGTILKDFESMLKFVGDNGVPVTGTKCLLPMKLLPALNERLTRPLEIDLQRPQQKSYPHIHGLYLLLRAAGIGYIKKAGKEQVLVLDEQLLSSWQYLNMTERYFSLLEAWWCRGSDVILGGREGFFDNFQARCQNFFAKIADEGIEVGGDSDYERTLRYFPGLHYVALMELFGFITIEHGPRIKGKGWSIHNISCTDWGNVVLGSFLELAGNTWDAHFAERSIAQKSELDFEKWCSLARPCFSEWDDLLTAPEHEFQEGVHVFKVSLGKAWRRIAIQGTAQLEILAEEILSAFDFDNDHLHQFIYKDRYGITNYVDHPSMESSTINSSVLA